MALPKSRPSRTDWTHMAFLALPTLLFVAFYVYPVISSIGLSLHDWDGFSPRMRFVGLQNYIVLATQPRFLSAAFNNIIWVGFMLIVPTGLGLLLAAILDRGIRAESAFRIIFFLPFTIPAVAVGAIWRWMYEPDNGFITTTLRLFGLGGLAQNWLGNPAVVNFSLRRGSRGQRPGRCSGRSAFRCSGHRPLSCLACRQSTRCGCSTWCGP